MSDSANEINNEEEDIFKKCWWFLIKLRNGTTSAGITTDLSTLKKVYDQDVEDNIESILITSDKKVFKDAL